MPEIREFFLGDRDHPPDFERSVTVVLAVFTVFTGFTFTQFLVRVNAGRWSDWTWWGFFALVALLLRYIFGSAIHLNSIYVGKSFLQQKNDDEMDSERRQPKSKSVVLLFKDLMFLVVFGMIAVYITTSSDILEFSHRAMMFVAAGFVWSILDYFVRRTWCLFNDEWRDKDSPALLVVDVVFFVLFAVSVWQAYEVKDNPGALIDHCFGIAIVGIYFCIVNFFFARAIPEGVQDGEWPSSFWRLWVPLDAIQYFLTWVIITKLDAQNMPWAIAILFSAFLFFDYLWMIRAVQLKLK